MSDPGYSPEEMMVVAAARLLEWDDVVFIGIGLPSKAANLARRTFAPGLSMIYESGTLDTSPTVLPLSIGDPAAAASSNGSTSSPRRGSVRVGGPATPSGFQAGAPRR